MGDNLKHYVLRKIKQVVAAHAADAEYQYGIVIDQAAEVKRIYAEYQAGLITIEDIHY